MVKGNKFINKSLAKDVENGHIVQELPEIEFEGWILYSYSSLRLIVSSVEVP